MPRTLGALLAGAAVLAAAVVASVPAKADAVAKSPLPIADPETVGLSKERLARIEEALQREIAQDRLPGAVVAIARRGKLAYFKAIGYRDKSKKEPLRTDALFSLASMTKPMVSVAIMMLYEEGRLMLSDPIGKHLPLLADRQVGVIKKDAAGKETIERVPAKRQPTIQDLLRHTSGITYGGRGTTAVHKLYPRSSSTSGMTMTREEFLAALGKAPLLYEPGTVWDYGLSTDVLGLIVEKVSGKTLGEFLKERIWTPLAMSEASFVLAPEKKARYALALPKDPINGKPQFVLHASGKPLKFECGGGCALSSTADYVRFAQMLLNGGSLDGKRLLGRRTVSLMTSDHLGPEIVNNVGRTSVAMQGYGFGLGFAVRRGDGVAGMIGSAGDYTWAGAYGTYFTIDPKEQLVLVFMAQAPGAIRQYHRELVRALVWQSIVD